ncbi:homoserine dehydrogenase [Rhodococcus sp. 05-2254-6]|uniref:homoserine dehydrogenase n=1 Tax=Rhodococcus sp. 05-2254-6 TaxID=2022489 RepID=UPI000B9BD722|nr:homoserine dehydrogenase [Rhodococcus sp. 05-2254-6]OZE35094.1 homoserine dehydrogenase [Rhodococcus sp. 05-2254-6]
MERSFRTGSAHASRFLFLIAQFVDRRIPAEFFSAQFRELQNTQSTYLDADVSSVIGMLSVDVGAYLGDVEVRGVDYIDSEQLWLAAGQAFRDLMTVQSEHFEREAG